MKFLLEMYSCCGRFDLRNGTLLILWGQLLLTIFDMMTVGPKMKYTTEEGIAASYVVISSVFISVTCAVGIFGVGLDMRRQSYLIPYVVVQLTVFMVLFTTDVILILWWILNPSAMESFADDLYLKPLRLAGKKPSSLSTSFLAFCTCFGLTVCSFLCWFFASVVHSYYLLLNETECSTASRRRSMQRSYARTSVNKPDPNTAVRVSEN